MYTPQRVIFEEEALNYELGKKLYEKFNKQNIEIKFSKTGRITGIPGKTSSEMYREGKNTLVVGIRKTKEFQTCKPSAHYAIPIVSGCVGMCEYCYLNTQMGKKPYIKIHVNIDDILKKAGNYMNERKPDITIFEGAATSDPVPVEKYSGALEKTINFFGNNTLGEFRFVTKFTDIHSLLQCNHSSNTTIRYSINTEKIIKSFEHRTTGLEDRVSAAFKLSQAGYKIGFIIAPVFLYDNWKEEYLGLLDKIKSIFNNKTVEFEVISHRFTSRAKQNILSVFPHTLLPMEEGIRKYKYGQFGYGKYVYNNEQMNEFKNFFNANINEKFGKESIKYII